jgi:DNA polymerase III sliding clamp (beta) subunit (PCNA family)
MTGDTHFSLNAEALLNAIHAALPLASKDEEMPHLTAVRFLVSSTKQNAELQATDGKALARVIVPMDECTQQDVAFSLQTAFFPTLLKALARISFENRQRLDVRFVITSHRIKVTIGDTALALPNIAEQLVFPDVEKVIPVPPTNARTVVTTCCVDPVLLARAMKAASYVSSCLSWFSPATALNPIRFDAVDGVGGLSATYVVMPMKLGADIEEDAEEGSEDSHSQTVLDGAAFNPR